MTNAPERIWIEGAVSNEVWKHDKQSCLSPHEYTRTDLIPAMIEEAGTVALEAILDERGAVFDAMVEAAEDAAGKDVSFNVVVGRAIRAAIRARKGGEA